MKTLSQSGPVLLLSEIKDGKAVLRFAEFSTIAIPEADFIPEEVECLDVTDPQVRLIAHLVAITSPDHGAWRIARERRRQIEVENFTAEDDDDNGAEGELVAAAVCYALHAEKQASGNLVDSGPASLWPWMASHWKPSTDPVRNLEKAGALIAAELDRLTRARERAKSEAAERAD